MHSCARRREEEGLGSRCFPEGRLDVLWSEKGRTRIQGKALEAGAGIFSPAPAPKASGSEGVSDEPGTSVRGWCRTPPSTNSLKRSQEAIS